MPHTRNATATKGRPQAVPAIPFAKAARVIRARHYSIGFAINGQFYWLSQVSMSWTSANRVWKSMLAQGILAGYAMELRPAPMTWEVRADLKSHFVQDIAFLRDAAKAGL